MTNLMLGLLGVAVAWLLLRLEYRLVAWVLRPEWLLLRALWRGARAIAGMIRRHRG